MNKIKKYITAFFFIIAFTCCFSAIIFADSSTQIVSKPLSEPAVNIDELLNSERTKAIINDRFTSSFFEYPDDYTYDTSVYLLQYNVSQDYWDNVTSFDYEGLTAGLEQPYPTIHLPVFGSIANSNGLVHKRVIGHLTFSYNPLKKEYTINASYCNPKDPEYTDNNIYHFYEEIRQCVNLSQTPIQQVFLIRYPGSSSPTHETIAVLQTGKDAIILDIGNTCHAGENGQSPTFSLAYSIEDYYSLRKPIEEELYHKNDTKIYNIVFWSCLITATSVFLAVLCVCLRKYYKKHYLRNENIS